MTIRLIVLCCFAAGSLYAQPDKLIIREYDSVRIEIEALGTTVNSPFNDYAPVITADGAELFFTTRRPATEREIKKNSEGKERVFYSNYDFTAKKWLESEALPEVINNPNRFNSAVAVSNDGQRLLIYQDDQYGNGDIYESFLKGSFWSSPLPISAPINTNAHESSASIAPNGQTIYFVSDREGGRGKRDIWSVSKNASGEWDTPKNLGRTINSTDDEESVF
ncbi:MAG: PD40 domain-containing protein, partial [Flavobacteriia bacterium]|nr:PD40 domain-containing protein [Flavobacteriia bacterium]